VGYRDLCFAARDPFGHCGQLGQRPGDAAHAYDGKPDGSENDDPRNGRYPYWTMRVGGHLQSECRDSH